jgi:hypothetical protein
MTPRSAREARIHLISEGVIAAYIHDIAAGVPRPRPAPHPNDEGRAERVGPDHAQH